MSANQKPKRAKCSKLFDKSGKKLKNTKIKASWLIDYFKLKC